jgi:hypothetical protein
LFYGQELSHPELWVHSLGGRALHAFGGTPYRRSLSAGLEFEKYLPKRRVGKFIGLLSDLPDWSVLALTQVLLFEGKAWSFFQHEWEWSLHFHAGGGLIYYERSKAQWLAMLGLKSTIWITPGFGIELSMNANLEKEIQRWQMLSGLCVGF